jgi:hypothetical protein
MEHTQVGGAYCSAESNQLTRVLLCLRHACETWGSTRTRPGTDCAIWIGPAYTHIGRDIDGKAWVEPGFARSDLTVIEGLAQFYTLAVAEKLNIRAPGVHQAFTKLLEYQSAPYKAHAEWLKDSPTQRGESVRFAMLRARGLGQVANDAWLKMLAETKTSLTANP